MNDNNEENIHEEITPTYTYDELHKDDIKDIATETPKEEVKEEVKEEPKEEVKPEVKEEVKPVEPDKLAEEISTKVAEKLSPQEEKTEQDKYDEFFAKINKEKGRDPNWKELSKFNEEQAIIAIEKKQQEAQRIAEEARQQKAKADEEYTKRFNAQIDEELDELYRQNKLSPIKDKSNPNDQGVIERKALFQAMLETNNKRVSEGKEPILSVTRIFNGYYTKPNAQPAGEDAPISLGKGAPSGNDEDEEIDYVKDIRNGFKGFFRR